MIERMALGRVALVVLAILSLAACAKDGPSGPQEEVAAPSPLRTGDPAPDFEVADLSGTPVKLSALAGRVRLVDFWATWCAPCRSEIPMLNDLHRQYADAGLSILALSDEEPEIVQEFAAETGMAYTNLVRAADVADRYGVLGLPTAFLVDRDGNIVETFFGEKPRVALEKRIRTLLGLDPAA